MKTKCTICGATEGLKVDHNHTTGEVRGVLCRKCDVGLSMFDYNPTLVLRAVDYRLGMLKAKVVNAMVKKAGLQ